MRDELCHIASLHSAELPARHLSIQLQLPDCLSNISGGVRLMMGGYPALVSAVSESWIRSSAPFEIRSSKTLIKRHTSVHRKLL